MPPILFAILQSQKNILTHLTPVVHFTPNYGMGADSWDPGDPKFFLERSKI